MGGMYVYPGGKRDDSDGTPEVESYCTGVSAKDAAEVLGIEDEPYRALGHFVAAVRETFEEAGVLLATTASGQLVDSTDPDISVLRKQLQRGEYTMLQLATDLGIRFDLQRLRYVAHWITPPSEPRRFSARFFLCRVPIGQTAAYDEHETTDGFWISPKQAIDDYAAMKFMTAPPTLRVLESMASHESIEQALAGAAHAPMTPKAPCFANDEGMVCLVLPGDPLHPTDAGPTKRRFELRDRRWFTVFGD